MREGLGGDRACSQSKPVATGSMLAEDNIGQEVSKSRGGAASLRLPCLESRSEGSSRNWIQKQRLTSS